MGDDAAAIAALEKDKLVMDKYSRQIGEYGMAAMAKLVQMKVLVIGLKGVGIEVAKNLILAGVGAVTLYDDDKVKISDLGTNFYLREEHVGKETCAEASLSELKSLNPLVKIGIHSGRLTNKDIRKFTMVVDCGLTNDEALVCNRECRKGKKSKTKFIRARVHGVMGYMFVDFGEKFTVVDKSGEPVVDRVIDKIESDPENPDELIVRIIADKRHNIDFDGHTNFIRFEEIEGELGEALNNKEKPFEVKRNDRIKIDGNKAFDAFSLRVVTGNLGLGEINYSGSGHFFQVKKAVDFSFKPLWESLDNPIHPDEGMLAFIDGAKWGRPAQLHNALLGLWKFEKEKKRLPEANNAEDVEAVIAFAKEVNESLKEKEGAMTLSDDDFDEEVVAKVAKYAECNFQPLCTFFGGIVAQEVIKFTGKYTPMRQWIHLDCFEVLPEVGVDEENEEKIEVSEEDRAPQNSRYDDLIKILGKPTHDKLLKSSTFMVGCGALGCELLKNFALLGLACDESGEGLITVTDNDHIEISNLSRQFLFREENVGQPKSMAAYDSVKKMNNAINVKSLEILVNPASESTFNSDFWNDLDFVTNALDNVKARLYVDSQCVFYGKALLESGTLGTKCNSQVIIPHKTASYADGPDDDLGDAIPMCTLRNFPTRIEHCIEWARAKFTDLFEAETSKASKFVSDPDAFIKEMRSKMSDLSAVANEIPVLEKVINILKLAGDSETTFKTCVEEAYDAFHKMFRDNIVALVKAKPADTLDDEGEPFWGKNRRFPSAAEFSTEDDRHLMFILSMANILSRNYGLVKSDKELEQDVEKVKEITATLTPPVEVIEEVDLDESEEKEKKIADSSEKEEFEKLIAQLEEIAASENFKSIEVEPADFEKDDDSNFHIEFIAAASNLRARNYVIKEVPKHQCKLIAGKIIPALATTTAAVTGLVCIELLKLIQPGKKVDAFRDSSNSLGVNVYQLIEPPPPLEAVDEHDVELMTEVKCLPPKFTKWDKTLIKGRDLTLKEFMDAFTEHCEEKFEKKLKFSMLYHKNAELKEMQGYSKIIFTDDKEPEEGIMDKPFLQTLIETYGETAIGQTRVKLECSVTDEEDEAYKLPQLVFEFV